MRGRSLLLLLLLLLLHFVMWMVMDIPPRNERMDQNFLWNDLPMIAKMALRDNGMLSSGR